MSSHAYKPDFSIPLGDKKAEATRTCDWPGCPETGEHRTSRSPRQIGDHVWYCAEHIREHNKSWNYFEGLSEAEVETEIRGDSVWQRPTWKMGSDQKRPTGSTRIRDDFGVFEGAAGPGPESKAKEGPARPYFNTNEARAYAVLDLEPPLTKDALKTRYKALVKRHHPDANDGNKASEEKFKDIAEAYRLILATL